MNAIIKQAYAVYHTDDRGYSIGDPVAIYLLRAAAEASDEYVKMRGYGAITPINLVQFEDVNYLLYKILPPNRYIMIGQVELGKPTTCYEHHIYEDGFDKSIYIVGDEQLIRYLDTRKEHSTSICKKYIVRDDCNFYVLPNDKVYSLKSFTYTREIAAKHALSKLTDEEKKLLGLI